jgi:predicted naringenin-chalcone synthase
LKEYDTSTDAIDHWLVHPGGPQILDAVERCLNLPADALGLSRSVLRRFGNMSSPTIVFILKELLATNPRGRAVAMAFGPGLTIELLLLELGAQVP